MYTQFPCGCEKKTCKSLEKCSFTALNSEKQDHPKIKFTFFSKNNKLS